MPWMAGAGAAASIGGAIGGGFLGSSGAQSQIDAMKAAIAYQKQKDDQTREDLSPYRNFGAKQLNSLSQYLNDPNQNPMAHLDPGYAFRLAQGNKGITANAGTAGLLKSGDTLRGLTTYGQDMSSQEYNNAFNRYLQEGQFKQGLAGMGEEAALGGGQLANQGAANVGNLTASTDWGGPQEAWANTVSGIGGMAGNAFARRAGGGGQGGSGGYQTMGGSNIFGGMGGGGTMKYASTAFT